MGQEGPEGPEQQEQEPTLVESSNKTTRNPHYSPETKPRPILKRKDPSSDSLGASSRHSAHFSLDMVEVLMIPKLDSHSFSTLFYDDEELAQFRYEAFCEKCGLDPTEFL
jgi:hypothetical protein